MHTTITTVQRDASLGAATCFVVRPATTSWLRAAAGYVVLQPRSNPIHPMPGIEERETPS